MRAAARAAFFSVLLTAAAIPAAEPQPCVQAVEFPYFLYPQQLWERELVWLKNIGIHTVEFPVPLQWHQLDNGQYDFSGRTSPRRDLVGFIRLLRKLGMEAWIAQPSNVPQLRALLETQAASHGGPLISRPASVATVSALEPDALARSRDALAAGRAAVLWTNVEDQLYPAGWQPAPAAPLVHGVIGLSGDEHPGALALRREAALARNWGALFPLLKPIPLPKPAAGKWPDGISAAELTSSAASAVSIVNRGAGAFADDVRVVEPATQKQMLIPNVHVPPHQALWLPLDVSLGQKSLCRECSNFSPAARIIYATAELLSIEFENGILAMEFAAPEPGEAVLQLERKPVGPFLAGGRPLDFEWDDKTLRLRLPIPANTRGDNRQRIGIAIEEPESSAFFNDAHRLVIGEKNLISTSYSSSDLAARSRLRLPEGYAATVQSASTEGIKYEVSVPAALAHGDYANLALEADGMPLGRARVQLVRAASIRLMEAIQIHIGQHTELTPEPPIVPIEPKAGSNIEVAVRNNWPIIASYKFSATGAGLDFFPPRNDLAIGAADERRYQLRIFATDTSAPLRDWRLRVAGNATLDLPFRALLLPRNRTVAWSADLDGDGVPEWVLESPQARAIFSTQDGGRWLEFTWKEANANFLPETGALGAQGPVEIRASGDALEVTGKGWRRTIHLEGATLTIDQSTTLPADLLQPLTQSSVSFLIAHPSATKAVYTLRPGAP
ncbi:MAG TPA: beta-galactosidase [Candidatus Limnocylindrales bacterium]|nr:beta-galactosidase [Candidatus Limnocylindrales bacterium]